MIKGFFEGAEVTRLQECDNFLTTFLTFFQKRNATDARKETERRIVSQKHEEGAGRFLGSCSRVRGPFTQKKAFDSLP